MVKNIDVAVFDFLKSVDEGSPITGVQVFDLKVDGVSYSKTGGHVDDIADKLDEYKQQIIDGAIKVPSK